MNDHLSPESVSLDQRSLVRKAWRHFETHPSHVWETATAANDDDNVNDDNDNVNDDNDNINDDNDGSSIFSILWTFFLKKLHRDGKG